MTDDVPKKEDGGGPLPEDPKVPRVVTPQTISEILIRSSKGDPNPTLTEAQLRTMVKYFRQGSHIPSYMPLGDFLEKRPDLSPGDRTKAIEEVRVWAKKNNIQLDWALILQSLRVLGKFDKRFGWGIEAADLLLAIYQYLNEYYGTNENQPNNIEDPTQATQDVIEEIIVTASRKNPDSQFTSLQDFQNIVEDTLVDYTGYGLEHVHVVAPKITTKVTSGSVIREGRFSWEDVAAALQMARIPNARTNIETAVNPAPQDATNMRPGEDTWTEPHSLPDAITASTTEISGSIETKIDTQTSGDGAIIIRSKVRTGERTRLEENKLRGRNERKNTRAVGVYAALLRFVNQTYGTIDEWREILVAFLQNTMYKGRPLSSYKDALEIIKNNPEDLVTDWEGFMMDVAANQVEDALYGKFARTKRAGIEGLDLYPLPRSLFNPGGP